MQEEISTPYEKTIGYKFGAAVLTYFGGLLATIILGCLVGYGIAWISIWMNNVIDELVIIFCVGIPTGIVRIVTRRANIMTALLSSIGSFLSIFVFYLTLDYQGLTWTDSESVWDNFWIYGIMALGVGAIGGFYKGNDK